MISHRRKIIASVILLALIELITFFIKVHGQFLADDFVILSAVDRFSWSIKGLLDLGTYPYAPFFRPVPPLIWKPLYVLAEMEPVYYHLVQLAFHFGNSLLIFLLFRKITREKAAFIGACLFSVYPGHAEAVMSSHFIFDTVVTFFFLLSIQLLTIFFEKRKFLFLAASLLSAVLSILSKENAITLPAVVFAFSVLWNYRNDFSQKRILSTSAFASVPYLSLFLLYLVFRHFHGLPASSLVSLLDPNLLLKYPEIIGHLVLPFSKDGGLMLLAAGVFLSTLTASFFQEKESRGVIVFGLAWVLITTIPTLSLSSNGLRFYYLPSIGFLIVLGELLAPSSARAITRGIACFAACALVFFYSAAVISTNSNWMAVWNTSRDLQESFVRDVVPSLKKPARVYLYGLPPTVNGIICFALGADECFDLLHKEEGQSFYAGIEGVRAVAQFPEKEISETAPVNYYFFDWNPSKRRFLKRGKHWVSPPITAEENVLMSWKFSRYIDADQWEPANELMVSYDGGGKNGRFITTGSSSFLKSPYIGKSIKYVVMKCRVQAPEQASLVGQVFWITGNDMVYNGDKSILFPLENDGLAHTYFLPLYINAWAMREPIYRLAFRFGEQPQCAVEIISVTVLGY